jgi:uncharacterized protein (TIGR03083 family)
VAQREATVVDRAFIEQLADVWDDLAGLGATLSTEDWLVETECPGWTVQDQLAHIVGTESILLGRTAEGPAPDLPHVHNAIGAMNETWIAPRRSRSGPQVLAEFQEVTALRLAALRQMDDQRLETVGPSPIGDVPYAVFMNVRVMDCWVHDQDMRQALGRPGALDGPAAASATDRLASSFGYVVGKRVAPPDGTTVVLTIAGPQARSLAVAMAGGRGTSVARPETATVTLTTDVATFTRLSGGRVGAEAVLAQGLVAVDGDAELGARVLSAMNVMP